MKEIDINTWQRKNKYEWFKSNSNSTYGVNVKIDVTRLVEYTKIKKESFFVHMMYIVTKALSSVDEMRMRLVNGVPVIFDSINPSFTVMTNLGVYDNTKIEYTEDLDEFYRRTLEALEQTKNQKDLVSKIYNEENRFDEYYITCTPWLNFESMSHPIPDDIGSQTIPRICWGKYTNNNEKYELTLNITVSHIFVDGYPLSRVFNEVQEMINNIKI